MICYCSSYIHVCHVQSVDMDRLYMSIVFSGNLRGLGVYIGL